MIRSCAKQFRRGVALGPRTIFGYVFTQRWLPGAGWQVRTFFTLGSGFLAISAIRHTVGGRGCPFVCPLSSLLNLWAAGSNQSPAFFKEGL